MISHSDHDGFNVLCEKLEKNIYATAKGKIRLELIRRDIEEHFPPFSQENLSVLDVGGGAGHFSRMCAEQGHHIVLIDNSEKMIEAAAARLHQEIKSGIVQLRKADFLGDEHNSRYDLIALHGSAEWMTDPALAISKAARLVRPGGVLSLLMYNISRHIFKRGVSGQLLVNERSVKRASLTPPGACSAAKARQLLNSFSNGKILLQSGIRVFHAFFRSVSQDVLTYDEWLEQEVRYYRSPPFNSLGEHTHLLWQSIG